MPHEAQTFLSAFESAFVLLHLPTANIIAVMTATYDKEKKASRLLILFNCLLTKEERLVRSKLTMTDMK
jgi:hypothetical protein